MIEKIKSYLTIIKTHKKPVILIGVFLGCVLAFFAGVKSSPMPFRLTIGNVLDQSFSLAFITYKPARACAVIKQTKKVSFVVVCDEMKTHTHLIDFSNLTPNANYKVHYLVGLQTNLFHPIEITTKLIPDAAPYFPDPAYGSVINEEFDQIPDSLVVLYTGEGLEDVLVAKTNLQGNYIFDLSRLPINQESLYIEAVSPDGFWGSVSTNRDVHSPFPPVEVKGIVKNL